MSYLDSFTKEQRELLVSLPYRCGMWVGESDDVGGDESAQAEIQTLETLITGFSEDFLKSEFVEEIMKQTLASKDKWEQWSKELDKVPEQCQQAVGFLKNHLDSKEVLSFRQTLMEIGMAVAMAYREHEEHELSLPDKMRIYGSYHWQAFMARLKKEQPPNMDEFLNISHSEREVLVKLSQALRVSMDGQPLEAAA